MEVILKEDIAKLGKMGEVVRVRNGYARNYLLPRGLVLEADKKNIRAIEHQKRVILQKRDHVVREAKTLSEKLAAVSLILRAKVGEEGKLFGSVNQIHIGKALKEKGFEIERRKIDLPESIKVAGDYEVPVRLAADVTATITVSVISDEDKSESKTT